MYNLRVHILATTLTVTILTDVNTHACYGPHNICASQLFSGQFCDVQHRDSYKQVYYDRQIRALYLSSRQQGQHIKIISIQKCNIPWLYKIYVCCKEQI